MLRVGDRGVLAKILSLSFRLRPRGRLPMTASAMKLLCRLADPSEVHRKRSSCIQQEASDHNTFKFLHLQLQIKHALMCKIAR